MAKMTQMWNEADTNGDGKLDRAEYATWEAAMKADKATIGEWVEPESHADEDYAIFNSVSEGDGLVLMELYTCFGPWMAKFEELKAADGAQ